jgi:hypothetical protein
MDARVHSIGLGEMNMDRWKIYGVLKREYTKSGRVPGYEFVFDEFKTDEMINDMDLYQYFCEEVIEAYKEIGLVVDRDQLHMEK